MQKETRSKEGRALKPGWKKPEATFIQLDKEISIILASPPGDPFKDLNPLKDVKPPNPFDV